MNQEVIIVRGNHTLKGDVRVSGAKNSALNICMTPRAPFWDK